ncbi:MAG: hypothetical protein ACOYLO_14695, partial [Ferruginibacter sp.]
MKNKLLLTRSLALVAFAILMLMPGKGWGQTPYLMSGGDYSEVFTTIAKTTSWPNGFNGTDSQEWAPVLVNATGTVGDGTKISTSTATFSTGSSGGVQRGVTNIYLLSTSTANSCAIDLLLNFTGRNAGTISFDVATVFNSTGNRDSKLKLFYSTDGTTFTEITGTNLPYTARNNVASSASVTTISLPSAFNNSSTARLRFYEYSTTLGGLPSPSGSQPKISIDNITVTSTSSGNTVPTLSTQAASAIGTTEATGNGTILANGGVNVYRRGFCWDLASNADPDTLDSKVVESSVSPFSNGAYTGSITGLTPGIQYKIRSFATNSVGVAYGSAVLFYTLSLEPSSHATSFTASPVSQTQIDLAFSPASSIANGAGYLILQRIGAAPTGIPVDGNGYVVGGSIGDATVATIVNSTSTTTANITGLAPGTQYYFSLFPFNWNGSITATDNYRTSIMIPTTNTTTYAALDATSDVSGPALGSQPDPVLLSSLTTTDATAVRVFDMDIYDYGTDGQPTKITQVTIKPGAGNTANWLNTIQGVKLSIDGGTTFVTIEIPAITTASIVIPIVSGNLLVPNNDAKTLSLFVYLKSTGLKDNQILEFKVDATPASHGFTADATGSTFLTNFSTAPISKQILIDVVSTKLKFIVQPTNTFINATMLPAVIIEATDANNNRDLDKTGVVTLTSSGTMTGPISATLTAGLDTLGSIVHTVIGSNLILTASHSGL